MDKITHEVRIANWQNIITQCQNRPAGMSANKWLTENGISVKNYYYYQRKLRQLAYQELKENCANEISFAEVSLPVPKQSNSSDSVAVIKANGITVEISNDISEHLLRLILTEVCHA